MKHRLPLLPAAIALTVFLALACGAVRAAKVILTSEVDNRVCMACHGKPELVKKDSAGRLISLFVDEKKFGVSSHRHRLCTECHVKITEIPHRGVTETVDCSRCHYTSDIVGATHSTQAGLYSESVHKDAREKGNGKAPNCQRCHGDHDVLPAKDPQSRVSFLNIPRVCGDCHEKVFEEYRESIHGAQWEKGSKDVPVCTSCHGEHSIRRTSNPDSPVFSTKVPDMCAHCHAAEKLMKKYGVPVTQSATYRESFHGVAVRYGVKVAANCASCHGAHFILPSSDPRSSISKANLPKTCGKCHDNPSANVAKGPIHVEISPKSNLALFLVSKSFMWLTIGTMIGLVIHILLDFNARRRRRREKAGEKSE